VLSLVTTASLLCSPLLCLMWPAWRLQVSHGNTAAHATELGDKTLGRICAAIAGDEARHEKAYIKIVDALFERCGALLCCIVSHFCGLDACLVASERWHMLVLMKCVKRRCCQHTQHAC